DVDVRSAETVDRLLGIADDEKGAGTQGDAATIRYTRYARYAGYAGYGRDHSVIVRRQQEHDLSLHGIGILKLVHEQPAILLLQRAPHVRVVAEHVRGHDQQVVEAECVAAAAFG